MDDEKDQEIARLQAEVKRLEWELYYMGERYTALVVQRTRREESRANNV